MATDKPKPLFTPDQPLPKDMSIALVRKLLIDDYILRAKIDTLIQTLFDTGLIDREAFEIRYKSITGEKAIQAMTWEQLEPALRKFAENHGLEL